jgi:glycosyltransferase involved in cell wall biosynthesis
MYDSRIRRKQAEGSHCLRVAFVQRRIADFRLPVFVRLAERENVALTVLSCSPFVPVTSLPFEMQVTTRLHGSIWPREFPFQPGVLTQARNHDVIVVEGSLRFLTSVGLVIGRKLHRTPIVWWTALHDPHAGRVSFPSGLRGKFLSRLLDRVDAVVTYSAEASGILQRISSKWRVFTAPNVLDTALLDQAESRWLASRRNVEAFRSRHGLADRPVILFVGRLVAPKRVPDLIAAFRLVRDKRPELNPELVIVGDGPEKQRLQQLVAAAGVTNCVKLVGEIRSLDAVCPWFLIARMMVLPGSGGLAIYQALSHGVPVVASRADGTERGMIQDGVDGFVVEPGDIDALAARIMCILDAPESEWVRLSKEARAVAHGPFHVNRMIDGMWQAIEAVASGRQRDGMSSNRVDI